MRFSISKVQKVNVSNEGPNEIDHLYELDVSLNKAYEIEDLIAFRDAITDYINEELKEKGGEQ